jgi:hypothetical protein
MPSSPIKLGPKNQIELPILRLPGNCSMPIEIVHIDTRVFSRFFEKVTRKRLLDDIKGPHSHPVGPTIANNYNIAIIGHDIGMMPYEIVIRPRRLQPILAISIKWNSELNEPFGKGDHILLKISLLVPAEEVDSRHPHGPALFAMAHVKA